MCMHSVTAYATPKPGGIGYKAFRKHNYAGYKGLYFDANGNETTSSTSLIYHAMVDTFTHGAYLLNPPYLRAFHIFHSLSDTKEYMSFRMILDVVICKVSYDYVIAKGFQVSVGSGRDLPCVSALQMKILEEVA